jgi:penicillin-binding protein 1A
MRAGIANLGRAKSQGASTITMQVARNVYLSTEKTFTRKLYEVLLTFKLEHLLSKDQILEIYMNQIFLGNRAYGFAGRLAKPTSASPLKDITIAEAAMLAGLPKAPSAFNPITNPSRARSRQLYIIERMEENGFITAEQADAAKSRNSACARACRPPRSRPNTSLKRFASWSFPVRRRGVHPGLNVYTTVKGNEQEAAYKALAQGDHGLRKRQIYRGPERFVDLPTDPKELEDAIDDALADHP